MWWKAGIVGLIFSLVLGGGWYLYNQSIKKTEDAQVMVCNTTQLEQELANAKLALATEQALSATQRDLLGKSADQIKAQTQFLAKTKVQIATIPDDKLGDRSKELLRILNERSSHD